MAADDRDRVLADVDGDADAEYLAREAALAGLPVALGEVGVVDVGLVHPDGVAQHDPVLVAGHRREHSAPLLESRLVGDTAQLGRHSTGTLRRMSLMKKTQARSGFRQYSRTVPVKELNLLSQKG